jgi:hypothetical protein
MPRTLTRAPPARHGLTACAEQQRDRNRCALTVILPCTGLALELPGAVGLIAPTAGSAIVLGHDVVTGGGESQQLTLVGRPMTAHAGGMSSTRRTVVRCLAGIYALLWLLPGFAIIDLTVTWDPSWPVMLEGGWGLMFGALVAAPFAALVLEPERPAAILQLTAVCISIALAAALSLAWEAAVLDAVLAAQIASIVLGGSLRPRRQLGPPRLSVPLLIVAAVGSGPWIAYAFGMFAADRENRPDRDLTLGVDHYSVQGALALALVGLTYLAALWPKRLWPAAFGVAVSAAYLGIVSAAHQGTPGGFSTNRSWAAVAWGMAVAVAAWFSRSRSARRS